MPVFSFLFSDYNFGSKLKKSSIQEVFCTTLCFRLKFQSWQRPLVKVPTIPTLRWPSETIKFVLELDKLTHAQEIPEDPCYQIRFHFNKLLPLLIVYILGRIKALAGLRHFLKLAEPKKNNGLLPSFCVSQDPFFSQALCLLMPFRHFALKIYLLMFRNSVPLWFLHYNN